MSGIPHANVAADQFPRANDNRALETSPLFVRFVSALISSGLQQYVPRMYNLSAQATLRALSANPATSIVPPTRCKLPATNTCTSSFLALPVSRTMLTACWMLGTTCTRSRENVGTSSDHAAESACCVARAERSLGSMAFEVRSRSGSPVRI
jgi:hypothetical protein